MNNKKSHWYVFYEELVQLYDFMLSAEYGCANILYQSKTDHFAFENSLDKRYRAILSITDQDDLNVTREHIERIKALFYDAVAIDNQKSKPQKEPKMPIYIPKILDDEQELLKIQIHENKAHSSKQHTKEDMIIVAACVRSKLSLPYDEHHNHRQILSVAANDLRQMGYDIEIEDTADNPYFTVSVDAKTMCDKHKCDSIQRRFFTGRQIRANFFTVKDDIVQKSKLATVGVTVLANDIDVVRSHQRSTRTDAKYIKQHIDEIILDAIPQSLRSGRLYKRYSE